MSSTAYKVLSDILQLKNSEANDFCCLCFSMAGEDAISTNDKVMVSFEEREGSQVVEEAAMSRILVDVLNEQVTENMKLFQSVCKKCTLSAIDSYKFLRKWKNGTESLLRAVENLTSCFEYVADDEEFKTLFVSVNLADMTIQQMYDTKEQTSSNKMALARFQYIAYGGPNTKNNETVSSQKVRDFSTIFIKTHELVADPSKPKEFKCKMCLKQYPTAGNLRQHFFSNHFKKEFQCDMCPKSFGTAGLLQSHISTSHITVECPVCGKKLLNRASTLKRHEKTHERNLKVCSRCGRTYKKRNDFERHIAQDTCTVPSRIPGKFSCDFCGYECNFKHQLGSHIKFEHTGAPGFKCQFCDRKCYSSSALKTHVLKHTKEKNFVCQDCGGKFVTKQSLLNHTRLHTGERPYPCDQCSESFLSASRRKDHIERIHNTGFYNCDMCDAKYTSRRSLVKHKKRHCSEVLEIEVINSENIIL